MPDQWVILREHMMNPSLLPIDGSAIALLSLEAELHAQGIETAFDPSRPGEYATCTRAVAQPFRLLVPAHELARAQEVARGLDGESGSAAPAHTSPDNDADEIRRMVVRRRVVGGLMFGILILMWMIAGRMG